MNSIKFFDTPLYIGNNSLYDILKICLICPRIVTHELCHFLVAKLCDYEVLEINIRFMDGFVKLKYKPENNNISDISDIGALVYASGHVGQTIVFTSMVPMLTYMYNKYEMFWAKILCEYGCVAVCGCNIGVFINCFRELFFSQSNSDFQMLMKNRCYGTILISKVIIGYCIYYSLKNVFVHLERRFKY